MRISDWSSDVCSSDLASQYVPYVMVLTAVIFGIAAIPSFLFLRERTAPSQRPAQGMLARLLAAWHETKRDFVDFRLLLVCGACYQAGIAVVITLSAVYATEAMGFTMAQTMLLVFTVTIAAAAGAFLFGYAQDRIRSEEHKSELQSLMRIS